MGNDQCISPRGYIMVHVIWKMRSRVDSRIPVKMDADERIHYVFHNPRDKCQMRRKAFKESFGVVIVKFRKTNCIMG